MLICKAYQAMEKQGRIHKSLSAKQSKAMEKQGRCQRKYLEQLFEVNMRSLKSQIVQPLGKIFLSKE